MLLGLRAVTVPIKSPMVSKAPEGVPVRGVVMAAKVLACVKSAATVVVVGAVIALLRLTSRPSHVVWPEFSVRLIGMLTVVAAPPRRGQTRPTLQFPFSTDEDSLMNIPLEVARVTL